MLHRKRHARLSRKGYVLDTHTAVASKVYSDYVNKTKDTTKTVIASTASPFKFTTSVMEAIEGKKSDEPDFELVDRLSRISGMKVPKAIEEIRTAPTRHDHIYEKENMVDAVREFLALS